MEMEGGEDGDHRVGAASGGGGGGASPQQPQDCPKGPSVWLYVRSTAGGSGSVGTHERSGGVDGHGDGGGSPGLACSVRALLGAGAAAGAGSGPPGQPPLSLGGRREVQATACGVLVALWRPEDADVLLAADLAALLGEPVHVTKLGRSRQVVLLQEVPRSIPLADIEAALDNQGVAARSVERVRHHVRVELQDAGQHRALLRGGLDFFGAVRFPAVAERLSPGHGAAGRRDGGAAEAAAVEGTAGGGLADQDDVLQCYRCQGFWHVSGNCRHLPRCVRCGEPHTVEFCPRPRHDPVCCHCAGPHHAAFRQCPVRRQLVSAVPMTITLAPSAASGSATRPEDLW